MQQEHHTAAELAVVTAKVSPSIAATGMHLMGYPIADWLVCATLLYTVIQLLLLIEKRFFPPKLKGDKL